MGNTTTRLKAADLLTHPSFSYPPRPDVSVSDEDFHAIWIYALEVAARLVSPAPKEDDEDEEFICDDVAAAIRALRPGTKEGV